MSTFEILSTVPIKFNTSALKFTLKAQCTAKAQRMATCEKETRTEDGQIIAQF